MMKVKHFITIIKSIDLTAIYLYYVSMKMPWPKTSVDYMEWFGTITGLFGAIVISSNIGYIGQAYISFIVSAIAILYVALKLERWGLFTMSLGYAIINVWGIWRWLILPMI